MAISASLLLYQREENLMQFHRRVAIATTLARLALVAPVAAGEASQKVSLQEGNELCTNAACGQAKSKWRPTRRVDGAS